MIKVTINDKIYYSNENLTILQLCTKNNIQVPKFCYHELLSIAGNCRMCLVQVNNSAKPVASCATNILDNMVIYTNNSFVQKVREGVLEFLLINHPLDCPICDQAGECDLQDQTLFFGSDRGRFRESKRSVVDKNLGSFVKTIMTRCIHCTRCVRFSNEIAGVVYLGTTGRGRDTEITNYIFNSEMNSVLSGNLVDICPVGALTSKPYAFVGRPWELSKTESIDLFDSVGSNIRIDSRGSDILRVLPRFNDSINDEWITDKVRFSYDGLKVQRLVIPLIRQYSFSKLKIPSYKHLSWVDAFNAFKSMYLLSFLKCKTYSNMGLFLGNNLDFEACFSLKTMSNHLFLRKMINFHGNTSSFFDFETNYFFNTNYNELKNASYYFVFGSNLELDFPTLNVKIRKNILDNECSLFYVGYNSNFNYKINHVGFTSSVLRKILYGNHYLCYYVRNELKKHFLVNSKYLVYSNNFDYVKLKSSNLSVSYLNEYVSDLHQAELNLFSAYKFSNHFINNKYDFVLNASSVNNHFNYLSESKYCVFQGTNGHEFLVNYHLLLPSVSFTEINSLSLNMQGDFQKLRKAVPIPGQSKTYIEILLGLLMTFFNPSYFQLDQHHSYFYNFVRTYYFNLLKHTNVSFSSLVKFHFTPSFISFNFFYMKSKCFYYFNDNEISRCSYNLSQKKYLNTNF